MKLVALVDKCINLKPNFRSIEEIQIQLFPTAHGIPLVICKGKQFKKCLIWTCNV